MYNSIVHGKLIHFNYWNGHSYSMIIAKAQKVSFSSSAQHTCGERDAGRHLDNHSHDKQNKATRKEDKRMNGNKV